MNAASDTAESLHDQANDLYWNSSETVDQLAARLGMSRNALYASVKPIPAGGTCPHCGEPLVFTNRSSRAAGKATCPGCEAEVQLEAGTESPAPTPAVPMIIETPVHEVPPPATGGRLDQLKESLAGVEPERAAIIGGAAALGAAVGAAAIKVIRRKS
ncbi:MAG TPA: hypothetical protein VGR27_12240 [Longimicrobiaceae bacterium]|nr:hypothetical protein [Longimicrobiaceae bacterium]